MAEQLKIVIDADVVKAMGGLKQLEKSFKTTENSAKSFGVNVAKGTQQATAALAKIPNTSGAATQSLINLSRVAQDAPFGFLGIANNINPLLESLQRLKAESKATGTSLKSNLLAALTGPAGIGLAVGVASSLLISFGDDLLRLISPSQALSEALDKAAESLTKNVGQVTVYVEALKSGTLTTAETKKVQKELIDQAPEFQSAFKGNTVNVEELDRILATKYIPQLVKSIKVTAAFGVVNEKLAESIKQIAKGGDNFSFGQKIENFLAGFGGVGAALNSAVENAADNVKKAQESLTSGNISKLIENTFKSLGITFNDAANTVTDGGKKISKSFDSIQNDIIARAREFIKEFGNVFLVPDLDISFTNTKEKVFTAAKKLLDDIDKGLLQLKLVGPRQVTIPIELDFSFKESLQKTRDNLFKDANIFGDNTKIIKGIVPGASEDVAKRNKAFFDEFQKQILATADLITGVLAPAFTGMFDAIVAGENPLKAFFKGLTESVNQLIKKLIAAAIQAAVLSALSGGSTSFGGAFSKIFGLAGSANGGGFGLGGAIAGRSFNNVIQIVGSSTISGNDIVTSYSRATNSNSRFGG